MKRSWVTWTVSAVLALSLATNAVLLLALKHRQQPQGKPEVLIWTFGGMLGYHGINSAGVAHFENALGGGPPGRFAMPHYPVERMMLECDRLDQVFDLLRKDFAKLLDCVVGGDVSWRRNRLVRLRITRFVVPLL